VVTLPTEPLHTFVDLSRVLTPAPITNLEGYHRAVALCDQIARWNAADLQVGPDRPAPPPGARREREQYAGVLRQLIDSFVKNREEDFQTRPHPDREVLLYILATDPHLSGETGDERLEFLSRRTGTVFDRFVAVLEGGTFSRREVGRIDRVLHRQPSLFAALPRAAEPREPGDWRVRVEPFHEQVVLAHDGAETAVRFGTRVAVPADDPDGDFLVTQDFGVQDLLRVCRRYPDWAEARFFAPAPVPTGRA
jgi:hypothetical protein